MPGEKLEFSNGLLMDASVASFVLVLTRVAAFVAAQPLLGGRQLPRLVKVGFALALSVLWFGGMDVAALGDGAGTASWLRLALAALRESLIGALLGFSLSILLLPARTAGEFIGQELGLALASVSDPTAENPATLLGQVFELLAIAIFFSLDAHHVWLAALHGTFERWPIGGAWPPIPVATLVSGVAQAHEWGLLLAAPLATCMFVSSIVLALMARAAPQLNLLSIGFSLRLGLGLLGLILLLPQLLGGISGAIGHFTRFLARLL